MNQETKDDLVVLKKQLDEMRETEKKAVFFAGKLQEEIQQKFETQIKEAQRLGVELNSKKEKYDYSVKKFFEKNFKQYMFQDTVNVVDLLYDKEVSQKRIITND